VLIPWRTSPIATDAPWLTTSRTNREASHDHRTAIVKVFDLTVATTGWNEKRLSPRPSVPRHPHHPTSHAGYYPDAKLMALKLLFDPTSGAILGAQGVGSEGVDKRIDVLATAIRAGLAAPELATSSWRTRRHSDRPRIR